MKVIEAIRNNGCKVLGVVTIFDYGFPDTREKLQNVDVTLTAITNFESVLRHAKAMDIISEEQGETIEEWQKDPENWKK